MTRLTYPYNIFPGPMVAAVGRRYVVEERIWRLFLSLSRLSLPV